MAWVTDWINDGFNNIIESIALMGAKLADDMLSSAFENDYLSGAAWKTVIGSDAGTASEGLASGNQNSGMIWDVISLMAPVTVALIAVQVLIGMFKRSKGAILRACVGGVLAIPLCLASVFLISTVDSAVGGFSSSITTSGGQSYMEQLGFKNAESKLKLKGDDKGKSCSALKAEYNKAADESDASGNEAGPALDNDGFDRMEELNKQGVNGKLNCGWQIDKERTDIWGAMGEDGNPKTPGYLYGMLLSTLAGLAGLVLQCVMFFRALALLLLATFAPIALMVLPFEGTKGWSVKWAEMVVGFILAKPAAAIVFALSMQLSVIGDKSPAAAVMGIAGMLMSAVAPFLVMRFLSFSPVGSTNDLTGGAKGAAGGVVRGGTSMVRGGRGLAGTGASMSRSITRRGRK